MEIETKGRAGSSAQNKKKARQGSKNKGYYANQKLKTMRNKRRREEARQKRAKDPNRKQPDNYVKPARLRRLARRKAERLRFAKVH